MKIWVDADACPKVVKETVFKFALRLKIPVCLVANTYMNIPSS
ncbi:MAG: YaiI/YqxD family protein, partial [Bacteriovoracaceae bacterium]